MPCSRAACLARLAAAAIRIGVSYFGSSACVSGSIGSTLRPSASVASSVWKAPRVSATGTASSWGFVLLFQLEGKQVGQFAEQPGIVGKLGVVLDQAGQLERRSPVGRRQAEAA